MIAGLGITLFYIVRTHPFFGGGWDAWFGIHPISCGVFGVPWASGDRCRQPADATAERRGAGAGGQRSPPGCW
jgi:hypothetical protein